MRRTYHFELPNDIGSFYMGMLVSRLQAYPGTYERLPPDMRARIEAGETVIHKQDLDRIDGPLLKWILDQAGYTFSETG